MVNSGFSVGGRGHTTSAMVACWAVKDSVCGPEDPEQSHAFVHVPQLPEQPGSATLTLGDPAAEQTVRARRNTYCQSPAESEEAFGAVFQY